MILLFTALVGKDLELSSLVGGMEKDPGVVSRDLLWLVPCGSQMLDEYDHNHALMGDRKCVLTETFFEPNRKICQPFPDPSSPFLCRKSMPNKGFCKEGIMKSLRRILYRPPKSPRT